MKRLSTLQKQQQQLEERRRELENQLQQQQQANLDLKASAFLLSSLCDSLSVRHRLSDYHSGATEALVDQLLALLEQERALLQQLHGLQAPLPQPAPVASAGGLLQPTIAPASDPMGYFKHLLLAPTLVKMPLVDAGQLYAQMVQELAIHVNQSQEGLLTEADASARIQPLFDRFFSCVIRAILEGRRDVVSSVLHDGPIGQESLTPHTAAAAAAGWLPPAAAAAAAAAAGSLPPAAAAAAAGTGTEAAVDKAGLAESIISTLGLSDWQLQGIVRGLPLFGRLLGAVCSELGALQQALTAAGEVPHSTAVDAAHAASSAVDPGSGSMLQLHGSAAAGSAAPAASSGPLPMQGARLEAQQQHAARMDAVCRKHALLSAAALAWLVGQLTWRQAARIAVLSWPYMLKVQHLGQAISQHWQAKVAAADAASGTSL